MPPTDTLQTEHDESETPEEEAIQAIVVVKSYTGKSYIADRDYIATMPALTSEEEVANFIQTYESSAKDRELVRQGFERAGFNIVAQDNLFLIVSGSPSTFQTILPNFSQQTNSTSGNSSEIFSGSSISISSEITDLVDGIIIPQKSAETNNLKEVSYDLIDITPSTVSGSTIQVYFANYDDILKALELEKAHQQGFLGKGVRVGFYDTGVYFGHEFFRDHPTNIKFFKFVNGNITEVIRNYDLGEPHGTQVASFLINSAPQAQFYSFAKGADKKDEPSNDELLSYLVYINSSHLVDIFSLSQGINEEVPSFLIGEYMAEIRMEFINFINDKGLVFVAGGNANECTLGFYCSGHNWFASYPEVISVGGSAIDIKIASQYYLKAASGAVSFSSIRYTNPVRNVPDVVSLFGPLKIPSLSGGYKDGYGTSFSTPQIAGMAALLKATMPNLSQYQLKEILFNSSQDITLGSSADGDRASVGYDRATGYGQPIATDILQYRQQLYPGWNLIGLTTTYDYTAESLLRDIQVFGSSCDIVSVFKADTQMYESIKIDPYYGMFGSDFDIYPHESVWVRCEDKTTWTSKGAYFDSTLSIPLKLGLNSVTIPFSPYTCRADDLVQETGGICTMVARFDGKFDIFASKNGSTSGDNFPLIPGEGYFVKCSSSLTWTPSCTVSIESSEIPETQPVKNIFKVDATTGSTNQTQLVSELTPKDSIETNGCSIPGRYLSNITDNTFSVIWTTDVPCTGYLLVNQGTSPSMIAYDDRGYDYSGTSHHITVRGLSPQTSYNFQIVSDTNYSQWEDITTGSNLEKVPEAKHTLTGTIVGANLFRSPSAVVYAWLVDKNENRSSDISVSVDGKNIGFNLVLDNTRKLDYSGYFDLETAYKIELRIMAGSGGYVMKSIPVSLSTAPINIDIGYVYLKPIPWYPDLQSPLSTTMNFRPSFKFSTTGANWLHYRLELSRDNFNTIEYTFDQNQSYIGWSSPSYSDGQTAQFTLPFELENLTTYYWRVFAYDVNNDSWSGASKIGAFSINRYYQYIPIIRK